MALKMMDMLVSFLAVVGSENCRGADIEEYGGIKIYRYLFCFNTVVK